MGAYFRREALRLSCFKRGSFCETELLHIRAVTAPMCNMRFTLTARWATVRPASSSPPNQPQRTCPGIKGQQQEARRHNCEVPSAVAWSTNQI
jgi:hypothetical protein